ncbi:MAG: DUF4292 domain-containing protein [Bacteroidota bacterium]
MKKFLAIAVLVFLLACKSKSVVVDTIKADSSAGVNKIIESHYNNKINFSTIYIKSKVRYVSEKQSQNVTAEIKIKKDEQILVSIRFLGITMAKASITPTSVSYYEKINGTYFEGDFSTLSQKLGTDLDYAKLQNILLGQAIDDLKKGKYIESIVDQIYRLDDVSDSKTQKSFYLDANRFLIQKQEIKQTIDNRMMQVAYSSHKDYNEMTLPLAINIDAYQNGNKSEINFEYDTVTFNEELSFPYSVPDGYKRIIIK